MFQTDHQPVSVWFDLFLLNGLVFLGTSSPDTHGFLPKKKEGGSCVPVDVPIIIHHPIL